MVREFIGSNVNATETLALKMANRIQYGRQLKLRTLIIQPNEKTIE
jgi:hypothetical protein